MGETARPKWVYPTVEVVEQHKSTETDTPNMAMATGIPLVRVEGHRLAAYQFSGQQQPTFSVTKERDFALIEVTVEAATYVRFVGSDDEAWAAPPLPEADYGGRYLEIFLRGQPQPLDVGARIDQLDGIGARIGDTWIHLADRPITVTAVGQDYDPGLDWVMTECTLLPREVHIRHEQIGS